MEQGLLNAYKKYDCLNSDVDNPLLKIFVSYIKPSFLFKTDILTPIHLGRSVEGDDSKDGIIPKEDLEWLHQNCIVDNDFEGNISSHNRKIGFLTGTYKAYKNYEQLGNPRYFGSFGYRRLFAPTYLDDLVNYDCIIPIETNFFIQTMKEQFIIHHGEKNYQIMFDVLNKIHPEDVSLFEEYFNLNKGYFFEMYIFKKDIFMDFCSWVFPLVFEFVSLDDEIFKYTKEEIDAILKSRSSMLDNNCNIDNFEKIFVRSIGFIMERLTGFYIYKLIKNPQIKYKKAEVIYTGEVDKSVNRIKLVSQMMRNRIKAKNG